MANQQPAQAASSPPPSGTLSTFPIEILTIILGHASKHIKTIKPEQWLPGSAEFAIERPFTTYLTHGIRDAHASNQPLPTALTAMNLKSVCKDICKVVDGNRMFHTLNNSEFHNMKPALT